jgi:Lon protease-like protein
MELPIFPLNTVLFPGATLPLHIFEERYRVMIGECIAGDREFGVCLVRKGTEVGGPAEPHDVGSTARITSVQRLEDGRMNILCKGARRFRINSIVSETPYLVADVTFISQDAEDDQRTRDLTQTAKALFAEYIRLTLALSNQWARTVDSPDDPAELSDYIAGRLAVGIKVRQSLLEEGSPKRRLEVESEALARLLRALRKRVQAARAGRWRSLAAVN